MFGTRLRQFARMTLVLSFWYTVEILNRLYTCVLLRLWLMTEQARRLRPSSIFCIANLYRSLVYGFGTKRWYSSPAHSTFLIWYNAETESRLFPSLAIFESATVARKSNLPDGKEYLGDTIEKLGNTWSIQRFASVGRFQKEEGKRKFRVAKTCSQPCVS